MSMLEFGSGRSSAWFAQRVVKLTSIEHDTNWGKLVKSQLEKKNIANVNLRLIPLDHPLSEPEKDFYEICPSYVAILDEFADESLDFIIVDGHYRTNCARKCLSKIKPGGYLLIDDTNWTSPLQRNLAARLIRLSDRCLTSKQGYAEIIGKFSQGKHVLIPALPVFSNMGEPEHLPPLRDRPRRLVVFGGRGPRTLVYQRSRLTLLQTCRQLEIQEIIDIGPSLDFKIETVNGISVDCLGVKSAEEISSLLSNSVAGFFNYHTEFLAKSTIFAAYCAHKLLPVGVFYQGQDVDGLEAGKHYWLGDQHQSMMNLSAGQIIADNAYAWYQTHKLSVQARTFATCLMPN